jgi:hypothetical protein
MWKNHVCLSRGVQVTGARVTNNDNDRGRSSRPGVEDMRWSHMSGTRWSDNREVGWRRVRYTSCTWRWGVWISRFSLKIKVDDLSVVWPQKHWDDFLRFDLNTSGDDFFGLASKLMVGFLVEPPNQCLRFISDLVSNPLGRFVSDLTSKSLGRFLPVWPQNRWRGFLPVWPQKWWWRVFRLGPQNRQLRFGDLSLKITMTIFWFGPQNQADYGLSVAP